MLGLKRILTWCAKHTPRINVPLRRRQQRRVRLFRRRAESLDVTRIRRTQNQNHLMHQQGGPDSGDASAANMSTDTLVNDSFHRIRAFSDPAISEHTQNVYSYYPWSESEHDEIRSRSPPPLMRPHYETFPSLVEMGGFLSL
ncbi:hypothetical protein IW140_006539 [Coemansia sp. RSA 1813]|nr:hypothetical protein EV178_000299 [Coemansia sp. RSA 1646]KAJ1772057.1 hypothetical protein LPJ74_001792 [Coemansia sp. RSA 1843]KAJ2090598.1 hypothetical protein IW138_002606 [Coemansia sp. RSA 986]KAJ2210148.1 hypothetical protein EV179_006419 [Coemansia sp. RSA 487]KAJ2561734.1 hypothetical protein IW140_006539 [Coemansia sp. RSA 1813]